VLSKNMATSSKGTNKVSIYQKLLPDGTPDPTPVTEADYDLISKYMKSTFAERKLHKGLSESLKRVSVSIVRIFLLCICMLWAFDFNMFYIIIYSQTFILKATNDALKNKSFTSTTASIKLREREAGIKKSKHLRQRLKLPRNLPYDQFLNLHNLWSEYIADLLRYVFCQLIIYYLID